MVSRLGLEGDEVSQKVEVLSKEIGSKDMNKQRWEERIKEVTMAGDYDLAFTDGSKLEDGKTGAGWTVRNQFYGGKGLGRAATVWDAEVTPIAETLKRSKGKRLLILSDSKAAIAAVVNSGKVILEHPIRNLFLCVIIIKIWMSIVALDEGQFHGDIVANHIPYPHPHDHLAYNLDMMP